jgi:hypothetical protein
MRFIAARTTAGASSQRPGVIEPEPKGAPRNATGAFASLVSKSAAENQERQSESVIYRIQASGAPHLSVRIAMIAVLRPLFKRQH